MENEDLITVVIPVYNVEAYLDACVASVVGQTCRRLEILLVDDGSTDSSGEMCDRWAERDRRIRVIHKENGGLSDARNAGIREARGKWIAFVDSDDLVSPVFLERMYGAAARSGGEVACCCFEQFEDGHQPGFNAEGNTGEDVLEGKALIEALYTGKYPQVGEVAWNKLYALKLFREHGIEYPKGRIHEDTFTTYRLLYYAKTTAVLNEPLYGYRQRSGSIMRITMSLKRCRDGMDADYSNVVFFKEQQEETLAGRALNAFLRSAARNYKRLCAQPENEESVQCTRMLMKDFRRVWREERALRRRLGPCRAAVYGLFAVCPGLISPLIP